MSMSKASASGSTTGASTPGKLEKMTIYTVDSQGNTSDPIKVQFNPTEYSISRGVSLSGKKGLGQESDAATQVVSGTDTTLSVSLYFDTISGAGHGSKTSVEGIQGLTVKNDDQSETEETKDKHEIAADKVSTLLRFVPDKHSPSKIMLVWGPLSFTGMVSSVSTQYLMFDLSGTPVRVKIDLTVVGEESWLVADKNSKPNESPDRTKERRLEYGSQLWLLSADEYETPTKWKEIARANGILNPRKVSNLEPLKVPSIQ